MKVRRHWTILVCVLVLSVFAAPLAHNQKIPTAVAPLASTSAVHQVSFDANSLGQTDITVSTNASQSKSFRIGAVINSSATSPITGIYGWQFGITYNSSAFVPVGDPSSLVYPDGASNTVMFGGQTSTGTANWAGLQGSGQAFGSFIVLCSTPPCEFKEIQVYLTLLTPAPALTISANTLLANVNFELLNKPSTPQLFTISHLSFVDQRAAIIPNIIGGPSVSEQITNAPPVASFTFAPARGSGPYAYIFNATASLDPDGSIANPTGYYWDFGDGSQDLGLAGPIVTHDYGNNVSFVVTLRIQDGPGATGSARDALGNPILNNQPSHVQHSHVPDIAPIASFTYTANVTNPQYVLFDGSASSDPDGYIKQWSWDFGDGQNGTGEFAAHAYVAPGHYNVVLTITDNGGVANVTSQSVSVQHPKLLHDVSLTRVFAYPTVVTSTQIATVEVAVQNSGRSNETVSVSAYYDSSLIGTVTGIYLRVQDCIFCWQYTNLFWDTTGVSPGNHTISATVSLTTDEYPSDNSMIGPTVNVLPPPQLTVTPTSGTVGTTVTVHAAGFPVPYYLRTDKYVEVSFDDQTIGHALPRNGQFNFTFSIPDTQPGPHLIKAFDISTGVGGSISFQVLPSLSVSILVGTIYFPQDTVLVYTRVAVNGQLTGPSSLQLQLFLPNGSARILTAQSVSMGVYRTIFQVPKSGALGTYMLVAKARVSGGADFSTAASFEVKQSWLSQNGPQLFAGVTSVALIGLAGVAWKKGYFRKKDEAFPQLV